jgi:cell division protein FtsB
MPKKIILFTSLGVAILIAYGLIAQIFNTIHSGDRLEQATNELNQLQLKNSELKRKLDEVKTDYFVEKEARDKLNLSREGETIIVIPDERINQILGKDKMNDAIRLPNWQGWLKLFFK